MIVFYSDRDNRTTLRGWPVWDIYSVNTNTGNIRQITNNTVKHYNGDGLYNPRFLGPSSSVILGEDVNFYYGYMRVNISQTKPVERTIIDGTEPEFDSLLLIPGGMGGYRIISSPNP